MRDLALGVLDAFKGDGLWTAQRQGDGTFRMVKTKVTNEQYKARVKVFNTLNDNGFTSEEVKTREEEERRRMGSNIK